MFNKQLGAACASMAAAVLGMGLMMPQGRSLEARVTSLEARVAQLEAAAKAAPAPAGETRPEKQAPMFVSVSISDRRFKPGEPKEGTQDSVWFDLTFDFAKLAKDARMVRGMLEFRSLAGETKFQLSTTLTEAMKAGGKHESEGKGFLFDPLKPEHRWVYQTDLREMQLVLRVQEVLYADGTRSEHR